MEKKLKTLQSVCIWVGILAFSLVLFGFGDYVFIPVIGATIALAAFAVLLGAEIVSHKEYTAYMTLSIIGMTYSFMSIIGLVYVWQL